MQELSTSSLSKFGYILRVNGKTWKSNQHPNLTLLEAGVTGAELIEFSGDFEAC